MSSHDGDDNVLELRLLDRAPEPWQCVHATSARIDEARVVVLPPCLVLLGATMVVDGVQHCVAFARRGAEVDRGLAAVGADLEQWTAPAAPQSGVVQREPFVVGHEPDRGAGSVQKFRVQAPPVSHGVGAHPARVRSPHPTQEASWS